MIMVAMRIMNIQASVLREGTRIGVIRIFIYFVWFKALNVVVEDGIKKQYLRHPGCSR